jgi:hypothetical protein
MSHFLFRNKSTNAWKILVRENETDPTKLVKESGPLYEYHGNFQSWVGAMQLANEINDIEREEKYGESICLRNPKARPLK